MCQGLEGQAREGGEGKGEMKEKKNEDERDGSDRADWTSENKGRVIESGSK